jgi:exo-beta-1,3-glucanase (GH17 family)
MSNYRKKSPNTLAFAFLIFLMGCTTARPIQPTIPVSSNTSPTFTAEPPATETSVVLPTQTAAPIQPLRGLAYSPYRDCESADTKTQPSRENVLQDLEIVRQMANGIRTYSSVGINAEVPAMAREKGLRVSAGAWLGKDKAANEREIQGLIDLAQKVDLESVIVGNEVLLRGDLSEDELLAYIQRVKAAVKVPVTTAEIGAILLQHPRLMEAVDYQLVHLYSFWESVPIENAARAVVNAYHDIQAKSNGKRVVIGETGWPSAGPANGAAVPSPENQARFTKEFLTLAVAENVEFYYFDAFDEMWKTEGGVGPFWGLLDAKRNFKYDIQSVQVSYNAEPQPFVGNLPAASTPQSTPQNSQTTDADFLVYSDFSNPENHFAAGGWMGDYEKFSFNICLPDGKQWPGTVMQVSYRPDNTNTNGWAGVYWLEPDGNWGTIPEAGYDLSPYKQLIFEARAEKPGTQIKFFVGGVSTNDQSTPLPNPSSIKTPVLAIEADPVDGYINLTDTWQEYHVDLSNVDLHQVIDGFGWAAERARTPDGAVFYLDNIRFTKTAYSPSSALSPIHIYSGEALRPGLEMGVDTSGNQFNWVENQHGIMRASYPVDQNWGVIFITVGKPARRGFRQSMDFHQYRFLTVEMRGKTGGEVVSIGIKDNAQLDNGKETKIPVQLTSQWKTYIFDLQSFAPANLNNIYIPIEFVFESASAEMVYFRNVQYLP